MLVNRWTMAGVLTLAIIFWARRQMRRHSGGDYNFGPVIGAGLAIVAIAALWIGVILSTFLG